MASYVSPVRIPSITLPVNTLPPPTPGPRSIENLPYDFADRFAGVTLIQKEENRAIEDYFNEYDHWEPYHENKSYSRRSYQAAYKGIMREYYNFLFILTDSSGNKLHYVVAKRIPTELESLEAYCTCNKCSASIFNPFKYIWCVHCTDCIKAGVGFARQEYIIKARALKSSALEKEPSKYFQIFSQFRWLKIFEIISVILFFCLFCYLIFLR